MQHHFRHAACHKHLHGGMIARPVGECIHEAWDGPVDAIPIVHSRQRKARRMRNGWDVEQKIRGAAKGRMYKHGIFKRLWSEDVSKRYSLIGYLEQGQRRPTRHVVPHRFTRWRQGTMGQAQPESFGDHLRSCRGTEKLAASPG